MNWPLGKTQYYTIHVEFQARGSPDIHSFIWILNAPRLAKSTKLEYATWIDNIISENFPNPKSESELRDLVKTTQIHSHLKTSKKDRNQRCRFHFGRFCTRQTIIAESLPNEILDDLKKEIMEKRRNIIRTVKKYIDTELNSSKKNLYDPKRSDFQEGNIIEEILNSIQNS